MSGFSTSTFDPSTPFFRFYHGIALPLQIKTEQLADIRFIFNNQYLFGHCSPLLSDSMLPLYCFPFEKALTICKDYADPPPPDCAGAAGMLYWTQPQSRGATPCHIPSPCTHRAHPQRLPHQFGIPRQSGLAVTPARIEFEPPTATPTRCAGSTFSHLWLIWQFSEAVREGWSPTVRPPKLGGNRRVGVFATRSPFRPNAIGLSSVRLERVEPWTPDGPILHVSGADLMDSTPLLDIKPYLAYTDAHPEASRRLRLAHGRRAGFLPAPPAPTACPPAGGSPCLRCSRRTRAPAIRTNSGRVYGFPFAGFEVRFTVEGGVLTVLSITPT